MAESGTAFVQLQKRHGQLDIVELQSQTGVVSRSKVSRKVSDAELDVAYDGTVVSVYKTKGKVFSRTAIADGRLGAPKRLAAPWPGALPEEVAAGPGGRGVVAWTGRRDEVLASQQLAGKGFGEARPIPKALFPSGGLELAASAGESFVVIDAPDQKFEPLVAVAPAGRAFGPATALKTSGGADGSFSQIDLDATGKATVAWTRFDPRTGAPRGVQMSTRPPGGTFTKGSAIVADRAGLDSLDVASDGGAVVSFNDHVRSGKFDFDQRVGVAIRPSGGPFLPSERVGTIVSKNGLIESFAATAAGAQPTVIWSEPGDDDELGVLASSLVDVSRGLPDS